MFQQSITYRLKLLLLLFGYFIFTTLQANDSIAKPTAKNGLLDVRSINLNEQETALDGMWELYWEQLITPSTQTKTRTAYTPFPALWENTQVNGKALSSIGYATYQLRVLLLQKNKAPLAIKIPDTYCAYQLFINGKLFASAGIVGTSKATTTPKWIERIEVLPISDTLDILLQVANFHHSKGGPYKQLVIGDKEKLFLSNNTETGFDLLLTGCLFMGGLFFIGLFLFGKHDKVILFFSLFCIAYSYRIIGSKNYVLHSLFPEMPWWLGVHLEYLSLFLSIIFFINYTKLLYPHETNKHIFKIELWAGIMVSSIVVLFPPAIFTKLISPFLLIMFLVIAHTFYIYYRAYQHKQLGAQYALGSTGVLFFIAVLINLEYFGIVNPPRYLLFIGYTAFFFLQSLILSFRFAYMLNEAKKQAEQGLVAKNEFLSTMSHEIRTPLNSILGMTHLMLRDNPSADQKEQLDVVLFSANNLLNIVNDILDYNKIEAGKVSFESIEMDIRSIAKNIVSGLKNTAQDKNIELRLSIDDDIDSPILGDPTRTSQILGNLVHNAIKFTRKGYVLLALKVVEKTDHTITILTRIEDTGIGIAQEKQKMVFEQFTQADNSTSRNFGGTGLGLAICKRLLDLQGSTLHLESEQGKGSVFYYTLPYNIVKNTAVAKVIQADSLPTEESKPLTNIHILLVEDNEVNILVAKTFLEKWGAIIDVAQNGQQAIDLLDINKHQLILMDMHMPIMDGYEATRIIRSRGIKIPIIALTASLPKEIEEKIKDTGIDDIVVKPFSPRELFKVILHYTGIHPF